MSRYDEEMLIEDIKQVLISDDNCRIKIACIESNCKNRVCVNTGFINKTFDNQIIVCAPHKVSVFYK